MLYKELKDKIYGSIIGFAIGDALGAPTEFYTKQEIKGHFDGYVSKMVGGGMLSWNAAQYTDDTEMMIAIGLETFNKNPNYAKALYDWHKQIPRDCGISMSYVFTNLPEDFDEKATNANEVMQDVAIELDSKFESRGNGALTRSLIPNILGALSNSEYIELAGLQGQITHPNKYSKETIREYGILLGFCFNEKDEEFWNYSGSLMRKNHIVIDINQPISGLAKETLYTACNYYNKSTSALYGLVDIVNTGGDTDSCAAIYGSFIGARYGLNGLMNKYPDFRLFVAQVLTSNRNANQLLELCDKTVLETLDALI